MNKFVLSLLAAMLFASLSAEAQIPEGTTLDQQIAPGKNFDKANFRLWIPNDTPLLQAIVVLMPGSNGDARAQVDDPVWRDFATRHKLALVGGQLTENLPE